MKIFLDDETFCQLSDTQIKVMAHDMHKDIIDEYLRNRIEQAVFGKYQQIFKTLKSEWDYKLRINGVKLIPVDEEEYAQLVFSQPNYKDKAQRVIEDTKG